MESISGKIQGHRVAHTVQRPQLWNLHSETEWDSWLEKASLGELKLLLGS
jgi:hypothetical protein